MAIFQPSPRSTLHAAVRDKVLAVRDRFLTDAAFQRWAARFPLTRRVARRQAQVAFDLCAGFIYSQVLSACVTLGVLDRVRRGAIAESALVDGLALPSGKGAILVNAAVALGLLQRRSGGFIGLGMNGGAIVANPGIIAMVEHHSLVYRDLGDPVALLAGRVGQTDLERFWPYAAGRTMGEGDEAARYSDLMSRSQGLISEDILDAFPIGQHRRMLDVGGGDGTFLRAVARRHPSLDLSLFDLPQVIRCARERFDASCHSGVRLVEGNFLSDELPKGYDLVSLIRVVHDHDDDRVLDILRRVRRCMEPGATLLVAEPMSAGPDSARVTDVYFAFYLLAMGSGRPRSIEDLSRLLRLSGFEGIRAPVSNRPMLVSLITATAI